MFCTNCGNQVADGTSFCPNCGASITAAPAPAAVPAAAYQRTYQQQAYQQQAYQQPYGAAAATYSREKSGGMLMAAFILCVVSAVVSAPAIFPLAWMIPMTIHAYKIYKGEKPNTTAFGVCTLLFVNLIGGILMLVSDKEV